MFFGKTSRSSARRLHANARLGEAKTDARSRLAKWLGLVALALLALGLTGYALWKTGETLFWGNPRYTLRHLVIRAEGPMLSEQHIREYTGIKEGQNLFALNLEKQRALFLQRQPNASVMRLTRQIPDTLMIEVTERVAIARLSRFQSWGVDREGWVFTVGPGTRDLPAITGFPATGIGPGSRVAASVFRALDVVDACRNTTAGRQLRINTVDVAPREYVELYMAGGERVRLAWDGMGTGTAAAQKQLENKLNSLVTALRDADRRGKHIANLDLTFGDQYIPAQEY